MSQSAPGLVWSQLTVNIVNLFLLLSKLLHHGACAVAKYDSTSGGFYKVTLKAGDFRKFNKVCFIKFAFKAGAKKFDKNTLLYRPVGIL